MEEKIYRVPTLLQRVGPINVRFIQCKIVNAYNNTTSLGRVIQRSIYDGVSKSPLDTHKRSYMAVHVCHMSY